MDRLIYDRESKILIMRIHDCERTVTGTPFEMFEGTPAQIDALITELGLTEQTNSTN